MRSILEITLLFVVATVLPHTGNASEIETKYLMFRIPKIYFDDVHQLRRPGGKLDFGNGVVLNHEDIEPISTDQPDNHACQVKLQKPLRFEDITIHPGCIIDFADRKEKKVDRYRLRAIDCETSSVEIDRVKVRSEFHSTFAKDDFHFASSRVTTLTDVPLANGRKVPPNKVIWIEDFDADRSTNPVSGISNHYPKTDK